MPSAKLSFRGLPFPLKNSGINLFVAFIIYAIIEDIISAKKPMPDQIESISALRQAAKTALQPLLVTAQAIHADKPIPSAQADIFALIGQNIEKNLDLDLKTLKNNDIFSNISFPSSEEMTEALADAFYTWQTQGNAPSLYALCSAALESMIVVPAPDMLNMVLMSAILGEIPNDQPYHNNAHFKKVVLNLIALIKTHNDIYQGTGRALKDEEICILLAAACIHDLGHDGIGNMLRGVHLAGRMEKLSFDLAKPYIEAAGIHSADILDKIAVMLLTTDVSPLDDPGNPMHQMKAAYRFHYLGEKSKAHSLNLSENIAVLEKDPRLATLSLLLHEADIATSAGLSYTITKFETSLLREEFCDDHGKPSHVIDFLNQICSRRFLSDAGQTLYAANLVRIYTLAEEDRQNGDQEFPESQHADFILGIKQTQTPKTIN